MNRITTLCATGAVALTAGLALAGSHEAGEHMGHGAMGDMPGSMGAMMGAMDEMMQAMPVESAGNADADFLLMMIPHHQSAIDMARVVLEQGDDEETRALAEEIIAAQEAEIAGMRAMLERMGVAVPTE